ncbi:MAG: hypothetical protein K0Q92_2984 [Steroidobacteraceae bacterium]|jgi:hypothetical protein|nr:hypothetical protein [Steroidobacteraceae bacterium]
MGRSNEQWEQYETLFKPLEGKMAETVANYDTQARRDQAASEAQAGVAGNFQTARQGLTENLAAQGAAGGGRGLALNNALNIQEAVAKAGAGNTARRNVEATGLSLLGSATNFGRGLTNTGLQTGQAAQANGQGAMGAVSGLSGLTGAGYNQALQGYGVGINGLLGQYQASAQSTGQQNGIFGDMLGAGMMAYGMYSSSKDAKTTEGSVDGKEALRGLSDLKVDHWTYKPGMGDSGSHVGPYAEDVQREFGDSHAPGGKAIDMVAMSKTNAAALKELSSQMENLQRELSALESEA